MKTSVGSALTSLHTATSFLQKDLEGLLVKSVDFRSEPYPDRRHRRRAPFIEFVPATPQAHLTFWCVPLSHSFFQRVCFSLAGGSMSLKKWQDVSLVDLFRIDLNLSG